MMISNKNTILKSALTALFLAVFTFLSPSVFAGEETSHDHAASEEKFNSGKLILEHISDAHDWHIMGEGEQAVSIPLPVILYTAEKGLDMFMSGKFEHGHATVQGKYNYRLDENNHILIVNEAGEKDEAAMAGLYDISITKNVASLFFSVALLLFVFLSIASAYKRNPNKAPSGLQSFMEPLIVFIRDEVAIPSIGKHKYEKFMPYLLTVFFFIWINNMLGIIPVIPGGANLTGNIAVTGLLAVFTFVITTLNGNKHYWHHIFAMPGVPKWVLIILTPIEIMGIFLRPFVLMIRLFANILAGHIIALSFLCLIFIFGEMHTGLGFGVGIVSVLFNVFMGLMEILVALIQAYVFTLLSAFYFGAAVEQSHNHKESIV
ncbi:MAG: F0F1 ATP synthase subunit A [Bacteroidetes bacterium]|nr:F0F1 ATP synthase subunit A [Bacteroidota bacterium]